MTRAGRETATLVSPYGGQLVSLLVPPEERAEWIARAQALPSIQLSNRALCDIELLATGALSPLDRFMGHADYRRVLEEMRLANGIVFPIPITLPVTGTEGLAIGKEFALWAPNNDLIGLLSAEELFEWDPILDARFTCGTTDARHPLVAEMASWGKIFASGAVKILKLPAHHDFPGFRRTPGEVRQSLGQLKRANVVALQPRSLLHRADEWITKRAAEAVNGTLLIQPAVGMTRPGDVDHYTRVRCHRALVENHYDPTRTVLSLAPIAMRMAGPREAVWHAIIQRNYGANHFILGRDHASPGLDSARRPFYNPYDAPKLVASLEPEIGVKMIPFSEVVYLPDEDRYEERERVRAGKKMWAISGPEVRDQYLAKGMLPPEWFTRPEVAEILARTYPPNDRRGFCVWLTGLSGAGKSTIAEILTVRFMERGRPVTLLDGDVVRTHLSKGLGFSKEDRDANVFRIGFVASEVVRHDGVVIAAAVSPYRAARSQVRALVGEEHFILVYVDTPLDVCVERDRKGLYARARRGEVKGVTGIDDPYEAPVNPELVVPTVGRSPEECAEQIVRYLLGRGFVAPSL